MSSSQEIPSEDLQERIRQLEAAVSRYEAKKQSLAGMSYEIRTPINAIAGLAELLLDSSLDETQREYVDMIKQSAEAARDVFDDVIEFQIGSTASKRPHIESLQVKGQASKSPLTILLAEDGLANQMLAVGILQKHNHDVVVANNGKEAFELFKNRPFDLVLMDIQMPEWDGLKTTEKIREHENDSQRTPIIAMMAVAMNSERERCLAAGIDNFLDKPIRPDELFEILANYAPTTSND